MGRIGRDKLFKKFVPFTATIIEVVGIREDIKAKNTLQFGHCPNYPNPPPSPIPQFGQLYRLFPADKNDVLRVWQKKILMMIIIVAMIILIKILVILMIMMTKNT